MSTFSHADYLSAPAKYTAFQTARIACDIPGTEYTAGRHVRIRYYTSAANVTLADCPVVPLYVVNDDVVLFANALCDFVL